MILTGALAMPAADAAPETLRIADPTARAFVTASPTDPFVRMQPRQNEALQSWSLDRTSPTVGTRVVNAGTRGCLTVAPSSVPPGDGTPLVQLTCQNSALELWRVVPDNATRAVQFVHLRTGLCMTVEPTSTGRFPQLRLFRCAQPSIPAQQFVLQNS
jgi:hypothetical protein